jgi:hypothetical protein
MVPVFIRSTGILISTCVEAGHSGKPFPNEFEVPSTKSLYGIFGADKGATYSTVHTYNIQPRAAV